MVTLSEALDVQLSGEGPFVVYSWSPVDDDDDGWDTFARVIGY